MKINGKTIFIRMLVILTSGLFCASPVGYASYLQSERKSLGKGTDFEGSGKVFLPNPKSWGPVGKDKNYLYRQLMPGFKAEVLFAAFDVDVDGFCKHDMLLEILYRDDGGKQPSEKSETAEKMLVKSRIDCVEDED